MKSESIWPIDGSMVSDIGQMDMARQRFINAHGGNPITASQQFTMKSSNIKIAEIVAGVLGEGTSLQGLYSQEIILHQPGCAFVSVGTNKRGASMYDEELTAQDNVFGDSVAIYTITATAERAMLEKLFDALGKTLGSKRYAAIKWWCKGDRGLEANTTYLEPLKSKLHSEFYPGLGDPSKFISDYLRSDTSVLLIAGPPGTGKTTLLRHMIVDHALMALVVYDEHLMGSDNIFQKFIFDTISDVLIIEDADTVLTSREHDNNKLMSRFLNVSDGLIKLPNKKLVFTTNISDFGRVDSALLRPGRCYATVHTRALTLEEAQAAAKVAGLPLPVERGEYTIAELFNRENRTQSVRRIGFVK